MENNIFKFITKEISHDAFICWLINWINIPENSENKEIINFAKKFIGQIVEPSENEDLKAVLKKDTLKVNIYKQFKRKFNKEDYVAIDILVVIENKYVIIIEDKINTGIHDNQIIRYKNGLMELSENGMLSDINISDLKEKNIITCYYKMFEELKKDTYEITKMVNKVFKCCDMLGLLNTFANLEKYQYLYDYYKYLNEMELCLKNIEEQKIKLTKDGNLLTRKEIKQIRYIKFVNNFENSDSYGISSTGYNTTVWRNIPLELKSSLGNNFFLKINLYYDDDNRANTLKLRVNTLYDVKERNALINNIEKKLEDLHLKKLARGSDANNEYTLLNYNIDDLTFGELKKLINNIERILKF